MISVNCNFELSNFVYNSENEWAQFLSFTNARFFRELVLGLENTQSNDPCTNITFLVIALRKEEKKGTSLSVISNQRISKKSGPFHNYNKVHF